MTEALIPIYDIIYSFKLYLDIHIVLEIIPVPKLVGQVLKYPY